jgi:hypothetical protein
MKHFIYGIVFGILTMGFEAWAPTIDHAKPSDYLVASLSTPSQP